MDELTKLKVRNAELEAALAATHVALEETRYELNQQQRELDALHLFDRELTRSEDLDYVVDFVLEWSRKRTRADYGIIARWDERRRVFEVLKAIGIPVGMDYQPGDFFDLPLDLIPAETTDKRSTSVLVDLQNTRMISELRHADGSLIGVLVLQRHHRADFSEWEKKFTLSVAERLAISMHLSMLLREVQTLNQRRRQLFRMLSHDLRQPLTVLMGYIQLVQHAFRNGGSMAMIEPYISHIATGANDLKDLLEEVLLMERVADQSRADWDVVSLRKICQDAIEKHSPQAALHNHTLEIELTEQEALCRGLGLELKEAAGNLIGNAIKYTPPGGNIRISLYPEDERWHFMVQDNGYGIDPERQERLFESFYRAQQPGTENIKGTGLGLNLVKAIIEKHDGGVFFESAPGKGSTFGFWLAMD